MTSKLVELLSTNDKFVLFTHVRPDGDALGSLFGLALILEGMGKDVVCCLEKEVSPNYQFMPQASCTVVGLEALELVAKDKYIGIALDSGDIERLGEFAPLFRTLPKTIAVDHHKSHTPYSTVPWVEPTASSTGEMVFFLAKELEASVTYEAAVNLYVAIVTDTGGFQYNSTASSTHTVAAELLELGVVPNEIGDAIHNNATVGRLLLTQLVLQTLDISLGGAVATIHVDTAMLKESGATMDDTDGFIDFPRSIADVVVAVFIKDSGEGEISVSLRAKGGCDVAVVAEQFGGGGHKNAAGLRMSGKSIVEIREVVVAMLARYLA